MSGGTILIRDVALSAPALAVVMTVPAARAGAAPLKGHVGDELEQSPAVARYAVRYRQRRLSEERFGCQLPRADALGTGVAEQPVERLAVLLTP